MKTSRFALAALPLLAAGATDALAAERMVLNFRGGDVAEPLEVPDTFGVGDSANGLLASNCFTADVFDLASGERLGTAEDCISEIAVGGSTASGSGVQVVGTTIFELDGRGRLVIQGMTSVQPVNWPTTNGSVRFTHVTGANSPDDAVIDGDGVFANTGDFVGAEARVRLSGQVDLARIEEGRITFDCIFVVDVTGAAGAGEGGSSGGVTGRRYDATQGEIFWDQGPYSTFAVYRDGALQATLDGASYYQSSLVDGVEYRYEVRAVTSEGERSLGEVTVPGGAS